MGTIEIVQRYAHLALGHMAAYANAVKFWSISRTNEKRHPEGVALCA